MKSSTYLIRFRRLLVLGAVIAGATASAAGAVSRPPDVRDAAAAVNTALPDVFERFAAAHPYGSGLSTLVARPPDVQDAASGLAVPDVLERYAIAHPYGSGLATSATELIVAQEQGRVGDARVFGSDVSTSSAARTAAVGSTGQASGFDWADYGIGIGSGIGLSLLLAAGLGMGLQRRQRMQTA